MERAPSHAWSLASLAGALVASASVGCSAASGGADAADARSGATADAGDARARTDARVARDAGRDAGDSPDASDAADAHSSLSDSAIPCDSAVTWTGLFNGIFGPSGTSSCTGEDCHSTGQAGFACAPPAKACYAGMVDFGLVTPGPHAPSSVLVNPDTSPLCGVSPGGDMPELPPPLAYCVTDAQVVEIQAWLSCGAPAN
jgi:hypothetical protein